MLSGTKIMDFITICNIFERIIFNWLFVYRKELIFVLNR